MTSFRVAFIFCKALALGLWINAVFGLLGLILAFVLSRFGFPTFGFFSGVSWLADGILALIIGATASSLSASLAGQSTLEGEAIAARRTLTPEEQNLARAGAGLITLAFGLSAWISYAPALYSYWTISKSGPNFLLLIAGNLTLLTIKIALGFLLAFGVILRRNVQTTNR